MFQKIKEQMQPDVVEADYDTKLPLVLAVDASSHVVTAVISYHIPPFLPYCLAEETEKPIQNASQILSSVQQFDS